MMVGIPCRARRGICAYERNSEAVSSDRRMNALEVRERIRKKLRSSFVR